MAGYYGSPSGVFLLGGYDMTANKLQALRVKKMAAMQPSHGIGDSWEESLPTGVSSAELAQEGAFFNTDSLKIHDQFADTGAPDADPQGTAAVAMVAFSGDDTIGNDFTGFSGAWAISYEALATDGELTRANAEYQVSGIVEEGFIVHELSAETADGDTESSSVDGGAANAPSDGGGSAYLEVTSLTLGGYDDVLITIRDSADDNTFGDLVAFTAVTSAPTAERVTVAGDVERYVACDWAFEGAGADPSVTFMAGFVRNPSTS